MERPFEYPQPSKYSNKVLIGPWITDRENAEPLVQETQKYSSTYRSEYTSKTLTKRDQDSTWNQIMKSELSLVVPEDDEEFYKNFSTLYDLSYNHVPKCHKSYIPRVWHLVKSQHEPTHEYLPSYGNLTEFGLRKQKDVQWNYDRNDPRKPSSSSYRCQFKAPNDANYDFKRFVVPTANFNHMSQEDLDTFKEKRRFCATHDVIESTQMDALKSNFCNPITWKCTPDMTGFKNNRKK